MANPRKQFMLLCCEFLTSFGSTRGNDDEEDSKKGDLKHD